MDDRVDACSAMIAATSVCVADVADERAAPRRHGPVEAGRQIVEHDDLLAGVEQRQTMWLPI